MNIHVNNRLTRRVNMVIVASRHLKKPEPELPGVSVEAHPL
jgi:hypothetical protein